VDDILVHKVAEDHYFLCVNASNQEKDFEHIRSLNRFDAHAWISRATATPSLPSRVPRRAPPCRN
jgi:glycine cleavage system aminomethyltransferase T